MGLFYLKKRLKVVGNMTGENVCKCFISVCFLWQIFSLLGNYLVHCFSVPVAEERKLASKDTHYQDVGTISWQVFAPSGLHYGLQYIISWEVCLSRYPPLPLRTVGELLERRESNGSACSAQAAVSQLLCLRKNVKLGNHCLSHGQTPVLVKTLNQQVQSSR